MCTERNEGMRLFVAVEEKVYRENSDMTALAPI
jgi:hypothetical protein